MLGECFLVSKPNVSQLMGQPDEFCELKWFDKISVGSAAQGNFFLVWEFRASQDDYGEAV